MERRTKVTKPPVTRPVARPLPNRKDEGSEPESDLVVNAWRRLGGLNESSESRRKDATDLN
jgi:hypothetical protein